jgi:molecular chaperone HscB
MNEDYFSIFHISKYDFLDSKKLEERFFDLQKKFHPSRFATQSESAKLIAVQKSILINQAYITLNKCGSRIKYILELHEKLNPPKFLDIDFLENSLELRQEFPNNKVEVEKSINIIFLDLVKEFYKAYKVDIESNWELLNKLCNEILFIENMKNQLNIK